MYAYASIRSAEVKIGPFVSDTSPKRVDTAGTELRKGHGRHVWRWPTMQTIIITPYVHNMIYHVPQMMKKHGSLRRFSGQGIFINLYEQVHGTREIESPALP